ncbi:MAG: hypothetical protein E8D41_12975 [Nitrospira sp.]|nr:MAG: hypothetical protein E8D41_12975 [Nitrospira sp.]
MSPRLEIAKRWRMVNCQRDYDLLRRRLQAFQTPVHIRKEAIGTFYRPFAYFCINADLNYAKFPHWPWLGQAITTPPDEVLY